eukprot:COSAG06_NODE_3259_length_5604_cov_7.478520_2_plen_75_part_00
MLTLRSSAGDRDSAFVEFRTRDGSRTVRISAAESQQYSRRRRHPRGGRLEWHFSCLGVHTVGIVDAVPCARVSG